MWIVLLVASLLGQNVKKCSALELFSLVSSADFFATRILALMELASQ